MKPRISVISVIPPAMNMTGNIVVRASIERPAFQGKIRRCIVDHTRDNVTRVIMSFTSITNERMVAGTSATRHIRLLPSLLETARIIAQGRKGWEIGKHGTKH